MADSEPMPASSSINLPPPPQVYAGAPGQQPYENNTNGQGNSAHMPPPPLPPVLIPQNTNPIPTAITSPGGADGSGMLSPGSSAGSFVRRAAPEPNKRALYVGGLDPRVTEDVLRQIFETTGHVQNVKIIPDKNLGAVCRTTSARMRLPYSAHILKTAFFIFYVACVCASPAFRSLLLYSCASLQLSCVDPVYTEYSYSE